MQYNENKLREQTSDSFAVRRYLHLRKKYYKLIRKLCEILKGFLADKAQSGELKFKPDNKTISKVVDSWLDEYFDSFSGGKLGTVAIPDEYNFKLNPNAESEIYEYTAQFVNSNDFKLQQIILDDKGNSTAKTFEILFWVVFERRGGIVYVPVSKHDLESNVTIVTSQFLNSGSDRSRSLIKRTPDGSSVYPCSVIFERRG